MRVSPLASFAPEPWIRVCWVSVAGAGLAGMLSLGAAPNRPETSTPTPLLALVAVAEPDPGDEPGRAPEVEVEVQAVSNTAGRTSNTAKRTKTPFGWEISKASHRA
jgi:hypothetical protein